MSEVLAASTIYDAIVYSVAPVLTVILGFWKFGKENTQQHGVNSQTLSDIKREVGALSEEMAQMRTAVWTLLGVKSNELTNK